MINSQESSIKSSGIEIPFDADMVIYYAIFSKSDEGKSSQCSMNYEDLKEAVNFWRKLCSIYPNQEFGIYQVSLSQLYIPKDP
jgi:hypothetical protein